MKNLNYYLISIPCIFSCYALYRTASLADSLIIASFCALVGVFYLLDKKYPNDAKPISEFNKLEEELKLERLKLSIEQLKEANIKDKAARDARAAIFGQDNSNKQIRF